MIILGLHGLPRSGKDAIASHLVKEHGFKRIAFADPLKEAAAVLLGRTVDEAQGVNYDREQVMPEWGFSMRWFLQQLGTECMRDVIAKDFWLKRAKVALVESAAAQLTYRGVVFTDVRFPNEADFIRSNGGKIIEIVRPDSVVQSAHASDIQLTCDGIIRNVGTLEQLYGIADALVQHCRDVHLGESYGGTD